MSLSQVQSSIGKQSELIFLHALLDQKKGKPSSEVIAYLDEVIELHLSKIKVRLIAIHQGSPQDGSVGVVQKKSMFVASIYIPF